MKVAVANGSFNHIAGAGSGNIGWHRPAAPPAGMARLA